MRRAEKDMLVLGKCPENQYWWCRSRKTGLKNDLKINIDDVGQGKPGWKMTWKSILMMWVKENRVEKWPENQYLWCRSRKTGLKNDLKINIYDVGQEKPGWKMTWKSIFMMKVKENRVEKWPKNQNWWCRSRKTGLKSDLKMQILKTGQEKSKKKLTWKCKFWKQVKKSQRKKWLKNANLENRSRKVKEKSDLKMQILKIGQEKPKKKMT